MQFVGKVRSVQMVVLMSVMLEPTVDGRSASLRNELHRRMSATAPGLKLAKSVASLECVHGLCLFPQGVKLHLDAIRSIGRSVAETLHSSLDPENARLRRWLGCSMPISRSASNLVD